MWVLLWITIGKNFAALVRCNITLNCSKFVQVEKAMEVFLKAMAVTACLFFSWRMFRQLKAHPELLKKENIQRSFGTMGLLALALILFVFVLVMMVR